MLNYFKTHTVPIGSKEKEKDPALIERGIFIEEDRPEYCQEYEKIVKRASGGAPS
jgi:2-oxoglutarate ferredoxin oxidoreductase subunit beta